MPASIRRPTFAETGLDFSAFGFFPRSLSQDEGPSSDLMKQKWRAFERILDDMKAGAFSSANALLAAARDTNDWDLSDTLIATLGYVAPIDIFRDMRRELEGEAIQSARVNDTDVQDRILHYCYAFYLWGRLDAVPVLLDQYLRLRRKGSSETDGWPLMIADMLTDDPSSMLAHGPPDDLLEGYLNLVMTTHDELVERLGSDKVHVFEGELLSVRALAEKMREPERGSNSDSLILLRERFEPMTGIDCSEIFTGEGSMALKAAAIAEEFLNSDQVDAYEDGVRYFFGHRVPD